MRAIVRNVALAAIFVGCAAADNHADIAAMFGNMAGALADDNTAGFMAPFDKQMPDYEKLRDYIAGLIGQAELTSDIEPTRDDGDDSKRSIDLDWTLQIRSREMSGPLVQRHETIHVELVKTKKHWRIVSISPLDFFAPAKFSPSK